MVDKLPRRRSIGGENGRAIAVRVLVDHFDRVVQRICRQNAQNRSENLLFVAFHF